jgi:uncharacterized protein YbjT (DUF2867 family)
MILVTGGAGLVGRAVLRHLHLAGYPVRILLKPSPRSPNLPRRIPVDVALAAMTDRRGLRAALVGIRRVIHLSGQSGLPDVEGTRNLSEACLDAAIDQLIYVSRIGAERSSAYPALRAQGEAEEVVRSSGVATTILRPGVVYGQDDTFTTSIAMLLAVSPVFLVPGDGRTPLQPLWVDDLATAVTWTLDDPGLVGQTYDIGGPEFFTFAEIVRLVGEASRTRRPLLGVRPAYLKLLAWVMEHLLPDPPITTEWMEYLAAPRTGELATLPRSFGLQPARMETQIDYLSGRRWGWEFIRRQLRQAR